MLQITQKQGSTASRHERGPSSRSERAHDLNSYLSSSDPQTRSRAGSTNHLSKDDDGHPSKPAPSSSSDIRLQEKLPARTQYHDSWDMSDCSGDAELVEIFHAFFPLRDDGQGSKDYKGRVSGEEDELILVAKGGTAFAISQSDFNLISTHRPEDSYSQQVRFGNKTLPQVQLDRASDDALGLVLMTLLCPGELCYSDPLELLEAYREALNVAKIYRFRTFSRKFTDVLTNLQNVEDNAEDKNNGKGMRNKGTAVNISAKREVDPAVLYAVAALDDDKHAANNYLKTVIIKALLEHGDADTKAPTLASPYAAETVARPGSTCYTNRKGTSDSKTIKYIPPKDAFQNINWIPTEAVDILKTSKPSALLKLLNAYKTYRALYRSFAVDLGGVNIRLEGFGTKCKRRFGRGCEAFIMANGKFFTLRNIAARAALKVVVDKELRAMCGVLEDAIEDAVVCTTCAHRIVNAFDAVMRDHFLHQTPSHTL
ncbi:hypothetical protein I317_02635 [Kwoniella heveanensis CBS 569]|nr:hypothetical protein I317_02635 [Kwoniella heveanensis CBS 569]